MISLAIMVILGKILQGLVKNMIFIKKYIGANLWTSTFFMLNCAPSLIKQLVLLNPPQDILDMVSILWQNLSTTFEQKEDLKNDLSTGQF